MAGAAFGEGVMAGAVAVEWACGGRAVSDVTHGGYAAFWAVGGDPAVTGEAFCFDGFEWGGGVEVCDGVEAAEGAGGAGEAAVAGAGMEDG